MSKSKSRSSKKIAQVVETVLKTAFIKKLREDLSIDWDFKMLGQRSLTLDMLYLLGVSIDPVKYAQYTGFQRFLIDSGVSIEFKKTPDAEVGK